MPFRIPSLKAEALYYALFDWQAPLSLWERSESLKKMLGDEVIVSRDAGPIEIKKILEGWVIGKLMTLTYHGRPPGEQCLVRLSAIPSADGQMYYNHSLYTLEVTQALYPGRKRTVFGKSCGGMAIPSPLKHHEQDAYITYRDGFIRQAFMQVETRIEHKFRLYKALDYLLVYVDLFDAINPRFGYFALQEFMHNYSVDLQEKLDHRFRTRWNDKIGKLSLLDDKPTGFVTHFPTQTVHAPLVFA